ncbi:DUF2848 family protein [Pseudonocardia thermophila]|uniref:DUF2848 family protein n=1 Tax=Pseudonocardia thermophila TaxID=1848 RepID=UPI00248EC335|nr:DUF2848 family protein [Pseudonocardia thermophila]
MTTFTLDVLRTGAGPQRLVTTPQRLYNLGSATVDPNAAVAHQREVADVGVRIAFDVPAPRIYPMSVNSVTTDDRIGVHSGSTSGEVELVLVVHEGEIFLGVGSDHTDRVLEKHSIIWAKQYCPSVLGRQVWRWRDVAPRWSDLVLESTVDGALYQRCGASVFLSPDEIVKVLEERVAALPSSYLVFCGTYTSIENTIRYGTTWTGTLRDTTTGERLDLRYEVVDLLSEIRPGFRVPLVNGGS